jgi:cell division protein FtsI (penicillin-binding protein 3)
LTQDTPDDVERAPRPSVGQFARAGLRQLFQLRVDKSSARVALVGLAFVGLFGTIGGRLAVLALSNEPGNVPRRVASKEISAARPDIVDRNGEVLATDVKTVSVFAEPRNIVDKDEARSF